MWPQQIGGFLELVIFALGGVQGLDKASGSDFRLEEIIKYSGVLLRRAVGRVCVSCSGRHYIAHHRHALLWLQQLAPSGSEP